MDRLRRLVFLGVALTIPAFLTGCPLPGGVAAPKLSLFPNSISFGEDGVRESFTIFNAGGGTLEWTVAETPDAPWLSLETAAGTTTTETDRIFVNADRSGLATGTYNAIVAVTSNGGTRNIPVSVTVAGNPQIEVAPASLNLFGSNTAGTFVITNNGDGTLDWRIQVQDTENGGFTDPPAYVTVSPQQGATPAMGTTEVDVEVDPDLLPEGVSTVTLFVNSDAGTAQVTLLTGGTSSVTADIGAEPLVLEFGTSLNVLTFDVFNSGAAASTLNFTLETNRPDLISFTPSSGTSIGSANPLSLDRVTIEVTLNRSALASSSDGGIITISAAGLESLDVPVTAQRAPLTLEGAVNRSRPPYLLRFVFLVRDQLGQPVDTTDDAILAELAGGFTIEENGEPLDLAETSFFVNRADNLRTNMVLLLDYTGSMFSAPPGGGSTIAQMVESSEEFIQDLPPAYRVALMEYHDRDQSTRLIHNFSTQRDSLVQALNAFSVPFGQNGASQVYDAIIEACERLDDEDINVLPFDDTDLRAVVFISDGRDTSSEASLAEVITAATDLRCRLYPIGFGEDVNAGPLVQLATETGGHYYPAVDAAALRNLLEEELAEGVGSPGQVVKDLQRQIVLTYVSLIEGSGTYLVTLEYEGNSGSFQRDAVLLSGDTRAGQISLQTTGINAGAAEIVVRTDYVPRGISQIRFRVVPPIGLTPVVTLAPGGLLDPSEWILFHEGDANPALTGVYTAIANEVNALPYASFGELFRINFDGVAVPDFGMAFRVDNRIYVDPPFTKFFQYPDGIDVGAGSSSAGIPPLTGEEGFDPDSAFAFDRDEDTVADFDDPAPDDDQIP